MEAPPPDRAPWWWRDATWTPPAMVAVVLALLTGIVVAITSGIAGIVAREAVGGACLAAVWVTGHRLWLGWRHRADDDVADYSPGVAATLVSTGIVGGSTPIARIHRDGDELATLHRSRAGGAHTVAARFGYRRLVLQHRAGADDEAVDLAVRWSPDDGPSAGAQRHPGPDADVWTLRLDDRSYRVRVPHDGAPHRRTLIDEATGDAYLVTHRRRKRRPETRVDAPAGLSAESVLTILWLAHLFDAHARAGEPWTAGAEDWTVVPDDFPGFVGPGGFGRTDDRPFPSTPGAGG